MANLRRVGSSDDEDDVSIANEDGGEMGLNNFSKAPCRTTNGVGGSKCLAAQ